MIIRKEPDGSVHIIVSEREWSFGPGVSITSPARKAELEHFCDRLAESVRQYELADGYAGKETLKRIFAAEGADNA